MRTPFFKSSVTHSRTIAIAFAMVLVLFTLSSFLNKAAANPAPIIGEKLTYNVSFESYDNIAFFEIFTSSQGKLNGRDAIEFRSRLKTIDFFGASLYPVNQDRQTFASPETGYPLYSVNTDKASLDPRETITNNLDSPANTYDLLTLLARVRDANGTGSFEFSENGKVYTAAFTAVAGGKVMTSVGEFETIASTVDSVYLTEKGITEFKINFSADEQRTPLMFSFKLKKGYVRARLSGREIVEAAPLATPTPIEIPQPFPTRTPVAIATPTPYVDDQPLSPDLPFALGETLNYDLSTAGRSIGRISFAAKDRRLFAGQDSLLLTASVISLAPGVSVLDIRDTAFAQVSPESLTPTQVEMHFFAGLAPFSESVKFDQENGTATLAGGKSVDVPVGTHGFLSFLYAVRTINLKPSKDLNNPVNDTRIAVFFDSKPYVFTLRPTNSELIYPDGRKVSCVLVSISTLNTQLDQQAPKIWLSDDGRKLPLRITFGAYQADLILKN